MTTIQRLLKPQHGNNNKRKPLAIKKRKRTKSHCTKDGITRQECNNSCLETLPLTKVKCPNPQCKKEILVSEGICECGAHIPHLNGNRQCPHQKCRHVGISKNGTCQKCGRPICIHHKENIELVDFMERKTK